MIRFFAITVFCLLAALANAQHSGPQMADAMRQDGKIYVVVAVIAAIFISLVIFLIYLERRLRRVERRMQEGTRTKPNP